MSIIPYYLRDRLQAPGSEGAGGGAGTGSGLDFEDPLDNLYAFGKLWATYADQPVFSAFHGLMFGILPGKRLQPLFGVLRSGIIGTISSPALTGTMVFLLAPGKRMPGRYRRKCSSLPIHITASPRQAQQARHASRRRCGFAAPGRGHTHTKGCRQQSHGL
jgi:hypothetical protein